MNGFQNKRKLQFILLNNKRNISMDQTKPLTLEKSQNQPQLYFHQRENRRPTKKIKKNTNPFEDLPIGGYEPMPADDEGWIKQKKTPLTIEIANYSKINKYYSHKSLQKYIRYLYANTCPNPLWLSIKRQSQIEHIVFIDIEIENSLFAQYLKGQCEGQKMNLEFLRQFDCVERTAIFKQTQFIQESKDLWQSLFCYDEQSIKPKQTPQKLSTPNSQLTEELYNKYFTYILSEQELKFNLYPADGIPAYKDYLNLINFGQECKNKNLILIVDCQMVLSAQGFQLARVSIMNFDAQTIYDKFFKPEVQITNYNTQFSGITKQTLENVTNTISDLHEDLKTIIHAGTILVGHSLENDLHAMHVIYDKVIDTSVLFARKNGSKMKLKTIVSKLLNRTIQVGKHCSEEDCQATLDILRYRVQVLENCQLDKQMHLLKELIEAKKTIVIIDDEVQWLKHQQELNAIHFQQYLSESSPTQILRKAHRYLDRHVQQANIIFTKLRKSKQLDWENYYENLDDGLRNLYNQCPINTVLLLNLQVNPNYRVYPQVSSDLLMRRPTCMILVKNE